MKSKGFIILTAIYLSVIFFTQFKLINRPVTDNDEGIYLTTFLLVNKGYPAYKKTYFSQPPGFLLSIYPGFKLFGSNLQAARLTVGIWSTVGILALASLGWAGLFAACLLFLIPSYYNQALTFQSDILITTFSLISLATLLRFKKNYYLPWFIISAIFLNLAFWTKFDITFFPSFGLFLLLMFKEKKVSIRYIINLFLIFCAVSLGFFIILILPFGIDQVFIDTILLRFQAVSSSQSSLMLFDYLKKDYILSAIILSSLLLSFIKNKNIRYPINIIYLWSIFVLIIFFFYKPLFPHHLVMLVVPTILLFSFLIDLLVTNKNVFKYIVVGVLLLSLINRVKLTINSSSQIINQEQKKAVEIIIKNAEINDFVVSDEEILNGISGRLPPPELSDVSQVRIRSNNLIPENFAKIIKEYKPKLIIPWNGRLKSIKNFDEVVKDYKIIYSTPDSTKTILLRR